MNHPAILVTLLLSTARLFADPMTFESAETPANLIELFTSEGCSSCPPADAWMSGFKSSPDLWKGIVPVVFHVDYWNGLGWPDRFSSHANTERQHRYAAAWRSSAVYTPGLVLNGLEWRDWSGRGSLPAPSSAKVGRLQVILRDRTHADVIFTRTGTGSAPSPNDGPRPAPLLVELALLGGTLESDVKRGENGGRKLRHDFVVLHLASAALVSNGKRYTAALSLPEKTSDAPTALAAWVTNGAAQPPIQATGGWLTKAQP